MNLEIFNLLGNETKNFVSSFVNELAKALDKGNNMNIGVAISSQHILWTMKGKLKTKS